MRIQMRPTISGIIANSKLWNEGKYAENSLKELVEDIDVYIRRYYIKKEDLPGVEEILDMIGEVYESQTIDECSKQRKLAQALAKRIRTYEEEE